MVQLISVFEESCEQSGIKTFTISSRDTSNDEHASDSDAFNRESTLTDTILEEL